MFNNVLIGIDGRQGGRDAIALAKQLASAEANLTLGHVCTAVRVRGAVELLQIQRAEAQQLLEHERELAEIDAQLLVRGPRSVGPGLHELAEITEADLLVVGCAPHAMVGRVVVGDDSRAALDRSPCAIGIAPLGYSLAPRRLHRLGVGFDGSPESEIALRTAREFAAMYSGAIKAIRVVSLEEVRDDKPIPPDWSSAIEELIERHSEELAQFNGVEGAVTYGGPREGLIQAANDLDLLIVGSRGYGPIGRLFQGSVSRYLVGRVTCPLLVLPRQAVREPAHVADRDAHPHATAGG